MERIWLSSPHMGGKEIDYITQAFSTNWVAPLGPNVDAFEEQIATYLGVNSVLSLNSGTAAIHLALELCGVKENDIVFCQSFTFAATAFPIRYCKADPVFIDSEPGSWNMDPSLLREGIEDFTKKGKKPAAIIVVHLYGTPAKMDEILAIGEEFNIPVIEDAAEALGSLYKGRPCGSIGKLGILSFNGNKIITTSGGGAITSNDVELIKKARHLSAQAKEPAPYYLHKAVGYNYRLSNLSAGVGRGQMEVLSERVKKRRENNSLYRDLFSTVNGISFPDEPKECFSNRWLTTFVFDPGVWGEGINNKVRELLEKENIETRQLWKPLHQQPVFSDCISYNNGTSDYLFANGLCLPSGSNLTSEQFGRVAENIKKILDEIQ